MQSIVIVGGGISGLSAAYYLEKYAEEAGMDISVCLLEGRNRLGGVIATERCGDFLLEGGPDSFLAQKPAAVELCRALGLADQLIPSNDEQRKTYILQGHKLKPLPDGLMFVVPTRVGSVLRSDLFSFSGKLRLVLSPLLAPRLPPEEDCSVAEFVSRRLGRQALERVAEPLLSAVYGADVDSLSARAALPQFIALEEKYGSLWQAIRQARRNRSLQNGPRQQASLFITLRNGVGEMVSALEKKLVKTTLMTGSEVVQVETDSHPGGYRVRWQGGELETPAVILATPAHATARMIQKLDPELAETLNEIPYHSSVIVLMGFEEHQFPQPPDGFGFVVPRSEGKKMLACTWVSTKFPFRCPPGKVLVRCFFGGARDPAILEAPDDRIVQDALSELHSIIGLRSDPAFIRIYRWERCMPQYPVGHPRRLQRVAASLQRHPGLFLSGNAYRGVGVPDCIQASSAAASAALDYLWLLS